MCKCVRSLSCVWLIILLLLISSPVFAAPLNLLKNPSFESVAGGFPAEWERVTDGLGNGTITFSVSGEKVVSGKSSAKIEVTVIANPPKISKLEGLYRQRIQIEQGKLYKLTFNYYRDNISMVMPYIVFLDSDGKNITDLDDSCIYSYSNLEEDLSWEVLINNGALRLPDKVSKDLEWVQRWIVVKVPAGTSQIEIRGSTKGGTVDFSRAGVVYFDDISAELFVK
jgi:hypothetical protein